MDAVSERSNPITLKVAVYEGDEAVTVLQTVKFESSSGNLEDRKKWVNLVLKDRQYNKKTQYRLVLHDAETGIEQQSVAVIIDRAFTEKAQSAFLNVVASVVERAKQTHTPIIISDDERIQIAQVQYAGDHSRALAAQRHLVDRRVVLHLIAKKIRHGIATPRVA